jgi:amino acid transporter
VSDSPTPETRAEERVQASPATPSPDTGRWSLRRLLFGQARDVHDRRLFHQLSLIPFLAWIGLGADGLSSSAYGPEEAFRALGSHVYLAVPLGLLMAATVGILSACYMRIIEVFPHGGGGYLVANKLLGERAGIVAGCALLVDYVLTITVSIAAACAALFSLLPPQYQHFKVPAAVVMIAFLTVINIRGVRESILVPIFMIFLITHVALILGGIISHLGDFPAVKADLEMKFGAGLEELKWLGLAALFLKAYSHGAGTYTGIEAVSNGLAVLRAPQVENGKKTMLYMAISLSFTAAGLIVCYLLYGVRPDPEKTMNATLTQNFLATVFPQSPGLQSSLLLVTLVSEGALLAVAAQAGFIGGPRVMANMAVDSFLPHRFASLSDRFTTRNGIIIMALSSIAALLLTGGNVSKLVLMYSINVFITFSFAQFGMVRYWFRNRRKNPVWKRRLTLFISGFVFCALILLVTVYEKFREGGWVTLAVTGSLVAACMWVRRYYRRIGRRIADIQEVLQTVREEQAKVPPFDPHQPTAVVLVTRFGGFGMHTILKILQVFPGYFSNFHFVSVGTIDSGNFKGSEELEALRTSTEESLKQYVRYVEGLGFPANYSFELGADTVEELEKLCRAAAKAYRKSVFFSGKVIFEKERWYQFIFHNQTAYTLQKRLQWAEVMLVILPVRIREQMSRLRSRAPEAGA